MKVEISEFVNRRQRLLDQMGINSVAVVPANREVTRSNDTEFIFRQNSDFHYLTGFPEPDAWLILEKNSNNSCSTLVCRTKDKTAEIWHGRRIGKDRAKQDFEFDHAVEMDDLKETVKSALNGKDVLYFPQGEYEWADELVFDTLSQLRGKSKAGIKAPKIIEDIRPIIHEFRLVKSDTEITIMRQAGQLSADGHKRAMLFSAKQLAAGKTLTEYQLDAEIQHEFVMNGASGCAYNTIVGSGENACILHYTENRDEITADKLVLIDAGCELQGYAGDITRTFPAGGKFSPEQKAIYQLVLDAQLAVFEQIKPGTTLKALTDLSVEIITQGLVELGILDGEVDELIANNAHREYYMHGLSHWLGLDVHDVGDYKVNDKDRELEPGMVFTVEPGIYISSGAPCDTKWHGIGVRIEDNVLVTKNGFENFTESAPKTVEEIETLIAVNS